MYTKRHKEVNGFFNVNSAGDITLNFFSNDQFKDFSLISIDSKGTHTDMEFLIFFFAGLFVLILVQVYKQTVEVKDENDYTV